jgi:DNA-binding response OmpR family regulator
MDVRSRAPGNMGDGSEKRQLGRIMLQRKALGDEAHLSVAQERPTRPASLEVDLRILLMTITDEGDIRRVDLRRVAIDLSVLSYVPAERARDRQLLPLVSDEERLLVAVADPADRALLDEIAYETGRTVLACIPSDGELRDTIEVAYAAYAAGAATFRGALLRSLPDSDDESSVHGNPTPIVAASEAGESLLAPPYEGELVDQPWAHSTPANTSFLELDGSGSPSIAERAQARRKVLVVDENDDIRRLLVKVFRERDFEVVESARGLDALEKVRAIEPDVLILDAMLSEVHGFDLCRRIKGSRRYGHIPVVMLSAVYRGWRFAEDLHRSYGVDAFLEKPFRIGEVIAAVDRAIEGRSRSEPPSDGEAEAEGLAADHLKAGIEAYNRGDLEAAIEELKKGVAVDPLAFRLHYHLGLLYGKQENLFDAIQALETAADLKPRDFSTLKNLAVLYQRAGFRLKAAEMWERALGSAPDDETRVNIRNHLVSLL